MNKLALPLLAALIFAAPHPAVASSDDFIMDTSSIGQSHDGVVRSEQLLELGGESANALRLEGESSLRAGHLDRALMVLQRSVEMAPMDIDGRILYAQALEQKLLAEKVRDPALFNFCVKQWVYVAKKAEFPDQIVQGRAHLVNLTGIVPRRLDREDKYLAKVLLPESGQSKVAMSDKKEKTTKGERAPSTEQVANNDKAAFTEVDDKEGP